MVFQISLVPLPMGKSQPGRAYLAGIGVLKTILALTILLSSQSASAWTLSDLNPWKQIREYRIFSLTRANPIGVRVMVVPVIDDPVNAEIVSRLSGEFSNALRSFATEVWLLTDLPDNPIKTGFYSVIPAILADYRLKNQLTMNPLKEILPDFQCDYVALFEVTDYDRFWIDEDLEHRVGVRAVLYDYETGAPKIEKYSEGGRGRRLEEGAFSEAERMAIKNLMAELEKPFRQSIKERQAELERRYSEVQILAGRVGQKELAIHQRDLSMMVAEIRKNQEIANKAKADYERQSQELNYWKQQAELNKADGEVKSGQPRTYSRSNPCAVAPSQSASPRLMPAPQSSAPIPQKSLSAAPSAWTAANWAGTPVSPHPEEPPVMLTAPTSGTGKSSSEDPWAPIEVSDMPPR